VQSLFDQHNQAAIIALFRVINRQLAANAGRVSRLSWAGHPRHRLAMLRWGMPP
jgi:hypothetical protein